MLRMGRSSKTEPTENEKTNAPAQVAPPAPAQPAQTFNPPAPAQTAQPAHVQATQATQGRPPVERSTATAATATTNRAVTDAEAMARDIKDGVLSGFVGTGTVLTGEANFKGMLRVDGRLEGNVVSEKGTLIVSSGGQVDADVRVAVARINGTVNGDITASERIEFGRTARVYGNIQTPSLAIEQGAVFEGLCGMNRAQASAQVRREDSTARVSGAGERRPNTTATPPADLHLRLPDTLDGAGATDYAGAAEVAG